jgi:hypothetical protein
MAGRLKTDWAKLSVHYRAGKRPLRDIGKEFGVSEAAIRKRAKVEGWPRDLSDRIQAKADDLVRKSMVRNHCIGASELTVEDENATIQANIRTNQMARATSNREVIEKLIDELKKLIDEAKLNKDQSQKTLASRVDSAKKLIESWTKATEIECKVYGIADRTAVDPLAGQTKNIEDIVSADLIAMIANFKT